MRDLEIDFDHRVGALADMCEALGRAGISVQGGGVFAVKGGGIGHFLVEDGAAARAALEKAGIRVRADRAVLMQRLRQGVPGLLGQFARRMAQAGVSIDVMYSDHANQLILVVDDVAQGASVRAAWMREHASENPEVHA